MSQALDISRAARKADLAQIVGYSESGPESLDSFIADLSVAIGAGQLTAGGILSGIYFVLFTRPIAPIHNLDYFNMRATSYLRTCNLILRMTFKALHLFIVVVHFLNYTLSLNLSQVSISVSTPVCPKSLGKIQPSLLRVRSFDVDPNIDRHRGGHRGGDLRPLYRI